VLSIGSGPVVWSCSSRSPGNPFEGEAVEGRDCGQLAKFSSSSRARCGPAWRSKADHSFPVAVLILAQFGRAGAALWMSSSLMSGSTMPESCSEVVSGRIQGPDRHRHAALHLGRGVQLSQGSLPLHSWLVWSVLCFGLDELAGVSDVGATLVLRLASGRACDVRVAGFPPMSTVFLPGLPAYVGGGARVGEGMAVLATPLPHRLSMGVVVLLPMFASWLVAWSVGLVVGFLM